MSFLSHRELHRRALGIRLLICDVDGVLTDGSMYFGPNGEVMKRFSTHDGTGIVLARRAGIEVAFLTREATPFARARAEKLGVRHCLDGVTEKASGLEQLCSRLGVSGHETAYIGDDVWDQPCASLVGLFFMPRDGWLTRRDGVHVILERGGGAGAVRQAVNFLVAARTARSSRASDR